MEEPNNQVILLWGFWGCVECTGQLCSTVLCAKRNRNVLYDRRTYEVVRIEENPKAGNDMIVFVQYFETGRNIDYNGGGGDKTLRDLTRRKKEMEQYGALSRSKR